MMPHLYNLRVSVVMAFLLLYRTARVVYQLNVAAKYLSPSVNVSIFCNCGNYTMYNKRRLRLITLTLYILIILKGFPNTCFSSPCVYRYVR